jgi:pilus assembly protein CpaE
MKVFLVDDSVETVKLLGLALSKAGYEIAAAYSGKEALAKIPEAEPDVVVMDVMMPDMTGYQVTRALRSQVHTADLPIILLTAKGQIEDKLAGFGSGADDYLTKPVLPAELIVRINALSRRAQRYAQSAQARARTIGFLGVKGGVGTTTVAVNMAVALSDETKSAIVVDLNRWSGAVALQMGITPRTGLARLAEKEPLQITRQLVESSLENHRSGIRVLAMPQRADGGHELTQAHLVTILDYLETLADYVLIDLGSGLSPDKVDTIKRCHLTVLVMEADAVAMALAGDVAQRLQQAGVLSSSMGLVMVNRARSVSTYSQSEIEQRLGCKLLGLITPAAEIASQANRAGVPILLNQPNTAVGNQFRELSAKVV